MSDEEKKVETVDELSSDDTFKRDENLPMDELLKQMKSSSTPKRNTDSTIKQPVEKKKEETDSKKPEIVRTSVEELSPLERMKLNKEKKPEGLVLSNDELSEGEEKPIKHISMKREDDGEFDKALQDADELQAKRDKVTLIKAPMSQFEYTQLMLEIDAVETNPQTGETVINLTDSAGNKMEPQYIKVRGENDAPFDMDSLPKADKNGTIVVDDKGEIVSSREETEEEKEKTPEELEKERTVQILIDKTGFGADFAFTEEEKDKIEKADVIKVNEVVTKDLNAILAKKSEKESSESVQDVLNKYDISGSRVTICFPASGFKAQMKGMTYGEYTDIALSMETITTDTYLKRLSIIYNKMTNISTGPFENFDDFLKHFAFTDIPLAIYAMYVATEPEVLEIVLNCGDTAKCGKEFNWKYSPRSVLKLDRCADIFLEKMKELATAPASEYERIKEDSAVENIKAIELPVSKFVVEMGINSAYDFLHNFIPLQNEEFFKETFGTNYSAYQSYYPFLPSIHAIHVPDGEGGYVHCYGYKNIMEALYRTDSTDVPYMAGYIDKVLNGYTTQFSLGKVVCPHCGNITPRLDIDIEQLVFLTYRRRMDTTIEFDSL